MANKKGGITEMTAGLSQEELEAVLTDSQYHQFLGFRLEEFGDQSITIRLPYNELFYTSADADGYIHGGMISTLIDVAGYYAIFRFLNRPVPTVDLHINFLRPGRAGDLLATATVVKLGRTVSIADIVVTDLERKQVAIGRGLFSSK